MILIIDNYDSFVYNLYQLIGEFNENIKVVRNDKITIEKIEKLNPEAIILSPGPNRPSDAGIMIDVIKHFYNKKPMLGICLGHQGIIEAFSGKIDYALKLMHGKSSIITIDNKVGIFNELNHKIKVARYHSLIGKKEDFPKELMIIGESGEGEIMAIKHKDYPVYGLQFHPESILTDDGYTMIKNFLKEIKND